MSRIEQIIDDMEVYLDDCKPSPFSANKVVVNKEEFAEMLNELRLQIPEEVRQYQKVINNQNAIINDARVRAEGLVSNANELQSRMIEEHEIMQKAYANADKIIENANLQAQAIIDRASADAQTMQRSIMKYSDDMMELLQHNLEDIMKNSRQKYESFYSLLEQNYNTVTENRAELNQVNSDSSGVL